MTAIMKEQVSSRTRGRIISAAGQVFADKGYHHTTVRDICRHARCNLAAVNYHFGGKYELYEAVFDDLLTQALAKYPPMGNVAAHEPAEKRLYGFIHALLSRILLEDPANRVFRIMSREMIDPTQVLDYILRKMTRPLFMNLQMILVELGNGKLREDQLGLCIRSIVGQCLIYRLAQPMMAKIFPKEQYGPEQIEHMARHITQFSLAGLHGIAQTPRIKG